MRIRASRSVHHEREEEEEEEEEESTELEQRITMRMQADTKASQIVSVAPGGQGEQEEDTKDLYSARVKCRSSLTLPWLLKAALPQMKLAKWLAKMAGIAGQDGLGATP